MQLDWENPFGNRSSYNDWPSALRSTVRTDSGVYIPQPQHVDIEKIQKEQRKLYPYFEALYDAAGEMMGSIGLRVKKLCQQPIIASFTYRFPDNPLLVNEFHHELTSSKVTLNETGQKSHPIIEDLFPIRPFKELSAAEQNDIRAATQIRLGCYTLKESDVPTHVRIVFPEAIHFVMHWLTSVDGPICDFRYHRRVAGVDTIQSNVDVYTLSPNPPGSQAEGNKTRDVMPHRLN